MKNEFLENANEDILAYSCPLDEMFRTIHKEPPSKMIYSGIKQNSVGFVFGPSKTGKSIFCENLGMLIAAGANEYLGEHIGIKDGKVLFVSLEEFYRGRTERNLKQAKKLRQSYGKDWTSNFHTAPKNFPRYLATNEEWQLLHKLIDNCKPDVVFIDSLSRLYNGSIEESHLAKEVMKRLRELANSTRTTIIVIHHTPKIHNQPLSIDSLAGSRILAQDADFLIGINKTYDNRRYVKEVAFRYHQENNETVKLFSIDDDLWLSYTGDDEEMTLLAGYDGRRTDVMRKAIFDFIINKSEIYANGIPFQEIKTRFVNTKQLTSVALNDNLNKLISEEKIIRISKGIYKPLLN
ncbi:MAG: AAA family ATPase [Bacteroidota bacterium]